MCGRRCRAELQALHRYENTVAVDAGERVVTLSENLASLQGASNPAGTASVDNGVVRAASLSHSRASMLELRWLAVFEARLPAALIRENIRLSRHCGRPHELWQSFF